MSRSGMWAVIVLAVVMISGMVVIYQKDQEETLMTAGGQSGAQKLPIYCVERADQKIALSFDGTMGNEDTGRILELLKNHQAQATFFVTGEWVTKYPDDVQAIVDDGHELGNYGESHRQMSTLSAQACREEIEAVHEQVKDLTGYEMELFRPPYAAYSDTLIQEIYDCGYYPILWNLDSLDWKDYGTEAIIKQVIESKELEGGSIIRFHMGTKYTADALDELLTRLENQGFTVVPISQLIYRDNYHMDQSGRQTLDALESGLSK